MIAKIFALRRSNALCFVSLFFCGSSWPIPAWPQQTVDLERSIATLPPAEQTYERFRFWVTQFPADLVDRGSSPAEADTQIKTPCCPSPISKPS